MRKKLIQWAFILMTLVPLQVTEKQGFDFGKFIKGNRNKIEAQKNWLINIKGQPFQEIVISLDDYFEVGDGVYITDLNIVNGEALILDKNGEIDVEINGNLYLDRKSKAGKNRKRVNTPIYVEYKK